MAFPLRFPLFEDDPPAVLKIPPSYQPLPSVWEGEDADLLEAMFRFYPRWLVSNGPTR